MRNNGRGQLTKKSIAKNAYGTLEKLKITLLSIRLKNMERTTG